MVKYKTFLDFVCEHGGEITEKISVFDAPALSITAKKDGDALLILDEDGEKIGDTEFALMDWCEKRGTEIRFCTFCGGIMQSGMTDDDGDFYNHEECFPLDMDERYGPGNWREMPTGEDGCPEENVLGGYYEYRDRNGKWEPEPSYYTEYY